MNQYDYQKELLQNRHPKYYQELIEREPYEFKAGEVRPIAYYLPQFHAFPENDEWWGKGFTEWTNVTKAMPQFEGHYQPHLAGELGYYDLMTDGVMERQIELAKMYGIYGFCFHFYMFDNRKRLLERPLNKFLANSNLDMPFCLCYANENWTRRWDGMENDVLIAQSYGKTFEADLADEMLTYLQDKRYILVDAKPLVIIYRINLLPEAGYFAARFREECLKLGIGEIYLASVLVNGMGDAREFGFDDNIEFPLHQMNYLNISNEVEIFNENFNGSVFSYPHIVKTELEKNVSFPRLRGVMPSWDNEARKPSLGQVFHGSTPDLYQAWLQGVCNKIITERVESERFVFINAWNEWAEGAHLEPDRRYGYAYLEATYQAILNQSKVPQLHKLDFNNLDSQQTSLINFAKYPENSFMQLFYYQNDEINIVDAQTLYLTNDSQVRFTFEFPELDNVTHIRIDLTNFPAVINLYSVKVICCDSSEHLIVPCFSNANYVDGNNYTYLHDDPVNLYYLTSLNLSSIARVEIIADLQPIKASQVLGIANQITVKQSQSLVELLSYKEKSFQLDPWSFAFIFLHYDTGADFNSSECTHQHAYDGMNFCEFDLSIIDSIKGLRLDPVNLPAHVIFLEASLLSYDGSINRILPIKWHNADYFDEERFSFYHDDPIIIFDLDNLEPNNYKVVTFKFKLELINIHQVSTFVMQRTELLNSTTHELDQISEYANSLQNKLGITQSELNNIQCELGNAQRELNSTQHELSNKQNELTSAQNELLYVYNSKSWKFTKPFRKFLSMFKKRN